MNRKELIYQKLRELRSEEGIDAQTLSELVHMSRANVSHELNKLCKEARICKSLGRPVRFFLTSEANPISRKSKLDRLVQKNVSLKQAVEQVKAAILYPPKGMNCLLLGDTGVGKSMFAALMYDYAMEAGIKAEGSPFIVFNCADYSNNPQLLTSQLFGVKKGTYTGAEADKVGLIEKANEGILFLDEVHRLPPEGQEALFTFLDTGSFRRMGDPENRKSDVLIISATTENPKSALLKTFTRRIPMIINIPSLKDRILKERLYLIKSFLKHESIRLNRNIYVSLNTMRAFLSYNCPNNIGQLKNDIQLVCAKTYSEVLTNIKKDVRINSNTLPQYIKEGLYKEKEHRILWNNLVGEEIEFFQFSPAPEAAEEPLAENKNTGIYEVIEQKLEKLKSKGISDIAIENILEKDITRYFEKYIGGISEEINNRNLINILGEEVLCCVDKVVYSTVTSLKRNLTHNNYTALALHIDTLIKRVAANKVITNPQLAQIKKLYPEEFAIALKAKDILEEYVHHSIPEDEAGYLTIFLLPEEQYSNKSLDKVRIILVAHGESTATSMAQVVNTLLGEKYVIGINAPIEVNPEKVLEKVKEAVKNDFSTNGYLLLVDMGSLTTFAEIIEKEFKVPVRVFSLVSTLHVLAGTRKALLGFSLDDIYNEVLAVNSYMEAALHVKDNKVAKKKIAMITACLTGAGGSIALKSFLNTNLKYSRDIFEIIPLDCLDMKRFKLNLVKIQQEKEILFIVSSFPIDLNIRQYSMYDVISMKVVNELQEAIDTKTTLLKMAIVLKENIHNVDGEELYYDLMDVLGRISAKLSIQLKDESLIGVILHMGFMVSRLKKGENAIQYPDKEKFIKKNQAIYEVIHEHLTFLYNKYFIEISDSEICYIINFFLH